MTADTPRLFALPAPRPVASESRARRPLVAGGERALVAVPRAGSSVVALAPGPPAASDTALLLARVTELAAAAAAASADRDAYARDADATRAALDRLERRLASLEAGGRVVAAPVRPPPGPRPRAAPVPLAQLAGGAPAAPRSTRIPGSPASPAPPPRPASPTRIPHPPGGRVGAGRPAEPKHVLAALQPPRRRPLGSSAQPTPVEFSASTTARQQWL